MKGRIEHLHVKSETPGERGIPKRAVDRIVVTERGAEGDFNRYRNERRAGDLDMALLLLPIEVVEALRVEGWPVEHGHLGENCTTRGIAVDRFELGQRWRLGNAVEIEIARICDPCGNLAVLPYVGKERMRAFRETTNARRGWYARVLRGGEIAVGDEIVLF